MLCFYTVINITVLLQHDGMARIKIRPLFQGHLKNEKDCEPQHKRNERAYVLSLQRPFTYSS